LNSLSYEARELSWANTLSNESTSRVYVAEDLSDDANTANRIVGFACGGPNRSKVSDYSGELYAIYILKNYQGVGIGKKLVTSLVMRMLQDGLPSMLVWVLADNPSRKFYEKLGGEFIKSQSIEIGDQRLEEVAYGWIDLRSLLSKLKMESRSDSGK
jgi:ribosomal protein S18 acetylase RimI-like enzyme